MTAAARVLVWLMSACLLLQACSNRDGRSSSIHEPRLLVIFVDLTLSLNEVQRKSVVVNLQNLVGSIPPETRVVVFPLLKDVQSAGPIVTMELGRADTMDQRRQLRESRGRIYTQIEGEFEAAKDLKNRRSQQLQQTCVTSALAEAAQQVKGLRNETPIDIVLISDMLESCDRSLFGSRIDFEQASIPDALLRRVERLAKNETFDLHNARVTVVRPASGLSELKGQHLAPDVVRRFWETVITQCNVDKANVRFADGAIPAGLFPAVPATGH